MIWRLHAREACFADQERATSVVENPGGGIAPAEENPCSHEVSVVRSDRVKLLDD